MLKRLFGRETRRGDLPGETEDAAKVTLASQTLRKGDPRKAWMLLQEVVRNDPEKYVYRYVENGKEYVKFWDESEFVQFATDPANATAGVTQVIWRPSAYPRAHYYLAAIHVELSQYENALKQLEAALELEPDQPLCFVEMGVTFAGMKEPEKAVAMFDKAIAARRYVTSGVRAAALRGKGIQLIDMGELLDAEACLRESQKYEPESRVARDELEYISELKAGRRPVEQYVRRAPDKPPACQVCGRERTGNEQEEWRVGNDQGRVFYLCPTCDRRPPAG